MSIAFLEGAEYETIESLNEQLRHKNDGMWSLLDSRNACIAQLVNEKKALREQVDELEAQLAAALATIERMVDDHATG